jgi:hypothetical protein
VRNLIDVSAFFSVYSSIKMTKNQWYTRGMKRVFRLMIWFFCSSLAIFALSAAAWFLQTRPNFFVGKQQQILTGRSIVSQDLAFDAQVGSEDARPQIVANFLKRYQSPLQPYDEYGQKLVEIADRYGIDFRLLPAIAMQESNLCKSTNPGAPHNCLGFGIHKSGTLDFDSYEDGFDRAGRELKTFYIDQGLTTVELIESKYTPSSNGSWANSVNQWMAEMRYDDRQLGREMKTNADVSEFAKER